MQLKVQSAILCDFVRTENNGKQILVGVYTGDILFTKFPARFAPTFWIEFKPVDQSDEIDFDLKINIPGRKKSHISSGKMKVEQKNAAVLVVSGPPLEIANPGILRLFIRPKSGRWMHLISKNIGLVESSLPSA